jgi:hypothetical protein
MVKTVVVTPGEGTDSVTLVLVGVLDVPQTVDMAVLDGPGEVWEVKVGDPVACEVPVGVANGVKVEGPVWGLLGDRDCTLEVALVVSTGVV